MEGRGEKQVNPGDSQVGPGKAGGGGGGGGKYKQCGSQPGQRISAAIAKDIQESLVGTTIPGREMVDIHFRRILVELDIHDASVKDIHWIESTVERPAYRCPWSSSLGAIK